MNLNLYTILILAALALTGCETLPVSVSYTGEANGHRYTGSYTTGKGVALTAQRK